jgi:palmitoyltransferase
MFGLFTITLFVSHVHWISLNQTTVEVLGIQAMKQRESNVLAEMFPWYRFE